MSGKRLTKRPESVSTRLRQKGDVVSLVIAVSFLIQSCPVLAQVAPGLVQPLSVAPTSTSTGTVAKGTSAGAPTGTMLLPLSPKLGIPASPPVTGTMLLPLAPKLAVPPTVTPTGTMLLPLTPKLDTSSYHNSRQAGHSRNSGNSTLVKEEIEADSNPQPNDLATTSGATPADAEEKATADDFELEKSRVDQLGEDSKIGADTTLKGTVQIVADDTEFDQDKNTFLGTGNAVALISGQNSKLEADMILYDQNTEMMDARGNVHIYRDGEVTTGSSFKFNVTKDEYLITSPDTELQGSEVTARKMYGAKTGLLFTNGTMTTQTPIYIQRNAMWGPISYSSLSGQKTQHPDAFVASKPSFKFKARKMVYERYKQQSNLTIIGGRIEVGKFSFPVGTFVTTVGKDLETTVKMPVTGMISNNLQVGGMNIGPRFNTGIGKNGVLSWAPLVQIGGKVASSSTTTTSSGSNYGLGAQASYTNTFLTTHLAYGSVSKLPVADFKMRIRKKFRYQAGWNRYLNDGMNGSTRAALMSELVDDHSVSNIPFLNSLNFRSSLGWAQDNPQLVNQSTQYAKLFGTSAQKTVITTGIRVQEQITATSQPLFNVGDDKYGVMSFIYGGVGLRGYSTGNKMVLGQIGPVLDVHLNRVRLKLGYTQSAVNGASPFVFDQFIQGSKSCYVSGDVRLNKYMIVGGTLGYNLSQNLPYQESIALAIGPEDVKFLLSQNFIQGTQRYGFDVLYGQPVPFQKLLIKNNPDQGQLGGGVQ